MFKYQIIMSKWSMQPSRTDSVFYEVLVIFSWLRFDVNIDVLL